MKEYIYESEEEKLRTKFRTKIKNNNSLEINSSLQSSIKY